MQVFAMGINGYCLSSKIAGNGTNILIPTGEAQVQAMLQ